MANGYLGKISAIVSANTADFDSKLSRSAAEVKKFAGSMQGTLTSAQSSAGAALRGIYTDAQKVQRTLTAVSTQKLSFKGYEGPDRQAAVERMKALYSATEQVNKPLAAAAKSFGKLSASVQAEFNPALQLAQLSVERLSDTIDRTGSASADHFARVAKNVDLATAAMRRMDEAGAMVSGLATGQELRFQRPEMVAEMQRSAALQADAARMSPATINQTGVAGLVAQQREAAQETERLAAAMENERLMVKGNVAAATAAYQAQLAVQRQINDEIERRIQLEASVGARTDISNVGRSSPFVNPLIGARTDISNVGRSSPFVNPLIGARTDISDVGRSSSLADRRRDLARTAMGADIEAPRRQLGVLESGITSLKSKIDTLPDALRSQFVPAIRDAEREFVRLSTAARPASFEIEAARQRLIHLTQDATRASQAMNFSESFGGSGMTGVNLGLDQRALQGYNAQLQILQGAIARASAEARGPAAAAFNRLRNEIAAAFSDGTLGTAATQQRLTRMTQQATQAAAAVAGIRVGTLARDVARAGDIGRGGFDKFSLALNQAAFAVDDFMSSTGGLEFKLRAVSNNITQLAFVLGGTAGLFIGLGAVIVGQAAVGLIKWINNGRTAEDQTKALNDSLAKQKNLVEQLADSFRELGDSIAEGTQSSLGKVEQDFQKRRAEIVKAQKEARDERVFRTDADVQRERAQQNSLQKRLESEENPGRRFAIEQQIKESQQRERGAKGLIGLLDVPSQQEVDAAGQQAQSGDAFAVRRFANLSERLAASVMEMIDNAAIKVFDASRGPAEQIKNAQEEVGKAIEMGLPGARAFAIELQKNADLLQSAYDELSAAQKEDVSPDKKRELVDSAQSKIDELEAKRAGMQARSDTLRYQRMVDPQQELEARAGRVRGNLSASGLEDGQIARRMREIENERESIRQRAAMGGNQGEKAQAAFAKMEAALNEEAAAIEATTLALKMFSDALNRASEEAKGNLNSAQQAADEARRKDLAGSTPETREDRRRAEANLERQRKLERDAQRELENQRAREEEIKRGPDFQRMQEIDEQLASGSLSAAEQEKLRKERAGLEAKVEPELAAGRRRAQGAIEASTREEERRKSAAQGRELTKTPEEKFAKETEQGLKNIRDSFLEDAKNNNKPLDVAGQRAAEARFMQGREREARTATAAGRGREAFMNDRERFGRDIREGLVKDMTAGAIDQAGVMNINGRRELLQKGIQNQVEQVAPMLQQFEEERQNARLQGPSRAALNMSDVSTSQGASELTRLLRGDDSAKDVNLAELRKQTTQLDELIEAVREANPGVLL